jgi:hypothetical protein
LSLSSWLRVAAAASPLDRVPGPAPAAVRVAVAASRDQAERVHARTQVQLVSVHCTYGTHMMGTVVPAGTPAIMLPSIAPRLPRYADDDIDGGGGAAHHTGVHVVAGSAFSWGGAGAGGKCGALPARHAAASQGRRRVAERARTPPASSMERLFNVSGCLA